MYTPVDSEGAPTKRTNTQAFSGVLAPAGDFASVAELLAARSELAKSASAAKQSVARELRDQFVKTLGLSDIYFTGSGKSALSVLLSTLKDLGAYTTLYLAAYTCPDIATIALDLGFSVVSLPLSEDSLQIDFSRCRFDNNQKAVLLLSNLYGFPDDLTAARAVIPKDWIIIDDACQALLSRTAEGGVGRRALTLGVASFGRGKALSSIGGGAILLPPDIKQLLGQLGIANEKFLAALTTKLYERTKSPNAAAYLVDLLKLAVVSTLFHPTIYAAISKLPFLHLGETNVRFGYRPDRASPAELLGGFAQLRRLAQTRNVFIENARHWLSALASVSEIVLPFNANLVASDTVCPIRMPVLLPSAKIRDRALAVLKVGGFGASASYPHCLLDYREFVGQIVDGGDGSSSDIAERILTFPVHRYVDRGVVQATVCALVDSLNR